MLWIATSLLCISTASPAATVEGPFANISYDAAVAEAKAAKKLVMIDFFTTWCGPCKRLDRITWKDPAVVEWLGKHTVALKIDAERDVELAQRFKIVAYPTLVFVNGEGKEVDRIRGFVDGATFIKEVSGLLAGKDRVARAKEKLAGSDRDPMARGNYADELVSLGKYEEALAEYLWCWDEGATASASYSGVRRSFLLADLDQLGKLHPPAVQAMRDRRDAAETRFKAHPDSRDDAADLCALNRTLADVDRTVAVYDATRKENALSTSVRQTFAREIVAPLATARRYSDIVDLLDVPVEYVKKQLTLASKIDEMTKDSEAGLDEETAERMKAFRRSHTVIGLIPAFEALAGMQRREEADRAADLLIEHANVDGTYTELVDAAARAGDVELARSIAERGFAALPESSRGLLRTAFDKLPGRK